MPNATRYVTTRKLILVELTDGSGSCTIDAGVPVLAETESIMVRGEAAKVFTVLTGPHTSKTFMMNILSFNEAFSPADQAK